MKWWFCFIIVLNMIIFGKETIKTLKTGKCHENILLTHKMFTVTLKSTNHFLYILLGLIKKYTAWYSKHDPPTHTPEKGIYNIKEKRTCCFWWPTSGFVYVPQQSNWLKKQRQEQKIRNLNYLFSCILAEKSNYLTFLGRYSCHILILDKGEKKKNYHVLVNGQYAEHRISRTDEWYEKVAYIWQSHSNIIKTKDT